MQTLFIDRKNAELEVDRGRLLVRINGLRPLFSVPTSTLELLVISASVQFTSTLLTRLTQEKVTTIFLNPRKAEASTMTYGLMHNDAGRRLLQYSVVAAEDQRLGYAKQLVRDKLRGQRGVLKKAFAKRLDQRYALTRGIERLNGVIKRVPEVESIDSLRGMEGAGGAAYFEAYQSLFPPSLEFNGRNRRPPRDPVNAILSLSYTMLHAEAVRTLFATGFDPMLGIYHEPVFGRESLACDLVELFRPMADRWVWRLFAEEVLRVEHFSINTESSGSGCLLGKRGREIYYTNYEIMARVWRRLMRRVARNWLAQLRQTAEADSGPAKNMSRD